MAIKVLPIGKQQRQADVDDFLDEIARVSALKHPYIVTIYGAAFDGNQWLLVQEYCQNRSLQVYHDLSMKYIASKATLHARML
jgi:serine/threonine protein kinase